MSFGPAGIVLWQQTFSATARIERPAGRLRGAAPARKAAGMKRRALNTA